METIAKKQLEELYTFFVETKGLNKKHLDSLDSIKEECLPKNHEKRYAAILIAEIENTEHNNKEIQIRREQLRDLLREQYFPPTHEATSTKTDNLDETSSCSSVPPTPLLDSEEDSAEDLAEDSAEDSEEDSYRREHQHEQNFYFQEMLPYIFYMNREVSEHITPWEATYLSEYLIKLQYVKLGEEGKIYFDEEWSITTLIREGVRCNKPELNNHNNILSKTQTNQIIEYEKSVQDIQKMFDNVLNEFRQLSLKYMRRSKALFERFEQCCDIVKTKFVEVLLNPFEHAQHYFSDLVNSNVSKITFVDEADNVSVFLKYCVAKKIKLYLESCKKRRIHIETDYKIVDKPDEQSSIEERIVFLVETYFDFIEINDFSFKLTHHNPKFLYKNVSLSYIAMSMHVINLLLFCDFACFGQEPVLHKNYYPIVVNNFFNGYIDFFGNEALCRVRKEKLLQIVEHIRHLELLSKPICDEIIDVIKHFFCAMTNETQAAREIFYINHRYEPYFYLENHMPSDVFKIEHFLPLLVLTDPILFDFNLSDLVSSDIGNILNDKLKERNKENQYESPRKSKRKRTTTNQTTRPKPKKRIININQANEEEIAKIKTVSDNTTIVSSFSNPKARELITSRIIHCVINKQLDIEEIAKTEPVFTIYPRNKPPDFSFTKQDFLNSKGRHGFYVSFKLSVNRDDKQTIVPHSQKVIIRQFLSWTECQKSFFENYGIQISRKNQTILKK